MRTLLFLLLTFLCVACGPAEVAEPLDNEADGAPERTFSGASWRSGRATNYGPGCDHFDPAAGNCLSHGLSQYEPTWFAAVSDVSPDLWGGGARCKAQPYGEPTCPDQRSCNRCFEVRCVSKWDTSKPGDKSDPYNDCREGRSVVVRITDACPHNHSNNKGKRWCTDGINHFDLGCEAFKTIAKRSVGVIHVQWRVASCSRIGPRSFASQEGPKDPPPEGGCTNTPPDDKYSCADQAKWGKCGEPWMKGHCDRSCGRCGSAPKSNQSSKSCTNTPPDNKYSCADQAKWGKCSEPWMKGHCDRSCGRC
jgi:hypothetical protein